MNLECQNGSVPAGVLQMTTVLLPLAGRADSFLPKEKQFFLAYWGRAPQLTKTPRQQAGESGLSAVSQIEQMGRIEGRKTDL